MRYMNTVTSYITYYIIVRTIRDTFFIALASPVQGKVKQNIQCTSRNHECSVI